MSKLAGRAPVGPQPEGAPVMHFPLRLGFLLVVACCACATQHREPCGKGSAAALSSPVRPAALSEPIRVALTIDDLPGSYDPQPDYPKSHIAADIVQALQERHVPAVGFANGSYVEQDADADEALRRWLAGGFPLANHSYAHRSANQLTATEFLADMQRNEAFLRAFAGREPLRLFRFPFLERGANQGERRAIAAGLARAGYRIANVSIDFADWAFAPAYARCAVRRDDAALRLLAESYVENGSAALLWARDNGTRIFGRAIPHVLLLHAQAATARNLPALLRAYETVGVQWISLEEALSDPAYAEDAEDDHGDTALLTEAARRRSVPLQSFIPRSLGLLSLACR